MRLKLTIIISICFSIIIIFFSLFGSTLRDFLSPQVTTTRLRFYQSGDLYIDNAIPIKLIHTDLSNSEKYIWIAVENSSSGEDCFYSYKLSVTTGMELNDYIVLFGADKTTKIISTTDRELAEGQRIVIKGE